MLAVKGTVYGDTDDAADHAAKGMQHEIAESAAEIGVGVV